MDICVFGKYKVKLHNKYSYISDYDYEMKESIFSEDVEEWEKVMDGCDFMQFIARMTLEYDTISISSFKEGKIVIEKFDPQDGTGGTIIINYAAPLITEL